MYVLYLVVEMVCVLYRVDSRCKPGHKVRLTPLKTPWTSDDQKSNYGIRYSILHFYNRTSGLHAVRQARLFFFFFFKGLREVGSLVFPNSDQFLFLSCFWIWLNKTFLFLFLSHFWVWSNKTLIILFWINVSSNLIVSNYKKMTDYDQPELHTMQGWY